MKKQITRISPHQTAKVAAVFYMLFCLIFVPIGILMLIFGGKERLAGLLFFAAPVLYGVMGYLFVGLACLVYNLIARFVGGIEFTVQETAD